MPTIESFPTRILERDWGTETFIAETDKYLGKILRMNAGTKGGLQFHRTKDETFYLVSGLAIVRFDSGNGLVQRRMKPGESYHIPPGCVHQVEALKECVFFEASNAVYDDRVRVEARYGLPAGGGLPTT